MPLKNALACPCACRCDNSNVCLGFIWNAASAACLYRGGVDALATRTFFVLPSTVDTDSLAWATPGGSGAVSGTPGVAACSVVVSVNGSAGVLQGGDNSTVGGGRTNGTAGNSTMQVSQAAGEGALPVSPEILVDPLAACPEPPAPPNNSSWPTNCGGASHGARCVAICNPGLTGSPYRTCVGGTWSALVGDCTVPTGRWVALRAVPLPACGAYYSI